MHAANVRRAEARLYDLPVERLRTDAIQSFTKQETPVVEIETHDGRHGVGYTYTIGTGGRAVLDLLRYDMLPLLIGEDARDIERLWQKLFWATHATSVGAITSLALAAVDTALWDIRCQSAGQPLWRLAGGAQPRIPVYDTEGGWLHLGEDELVDEALASKRRGLPGIKLKVGKTSAAEDAHRLLAVREAVGPELHLMADANQAWSWPEAARRARLYEPADVFWLEEPIPAEDVTGHARLAASTPIPIAVGESIYAPSHFREYLAAGAAGVVQVDVARIGGITPWLKVAHLADAFNVKVAPHFLMELHVSLCCAVPNAIYLEHIPQLGTVTNAPLRIEEGFAYPPEEAGIGIGFDTDKLEAYRAG